MDWDIPISNHLYYLVSFIYILYQLFKEGNNVF